MMAIGFDAALGYVRIAGEAELFPPRALVASLVGDQIRATRATNGEAVVYAPFDALSTLDGAPFASAEACLAYVQAALERRPTGAAIEGSTAAADLGGHRIVRVAGPGAVDLASCERPEQAATVLGLTLGAARAGDPIDVLTRGPVEEPSWSFLPGPAFLGIAGSIVQAPPAAGFRQTLGTFVSPTRLVLALGPPILIA